MTKEQAKAGHTVVETPSYLSAAAEAGVSEKTRQAIVDAVSENPQLGMLVPGTGGVRKFRFGRPGQGKSGSYRVATYYHSEGLPVFLLTAFGKNDKANLTKAERNALHDLVKVLAERYRAQTERKVRK